MQGHIRSHGEHAWRIYVSLGSDPVTGRRRQVTKVIHGTRKEAETALARLLVEAADGHHAGDATMTLGQLLRAFIDHKMVSLEETSVDTLRNSAGYLPDKFSAMPIGKVTVAHLEALYAHLILKGRKRIPKTGPNAGSTRLDAKTVKNVHTTIHGAFELARRRQWVTVNPAADAEVPKVHKRIPTPASGSALPALFAEAENVYPLLLPTFLRASVCAGTRRSEMHGLRWSGVDFADHRVTIRDVIVRAGSPPRWVVKPRTKVGGERTVYLDANTMAMLRLVYDRAFELAATCGADLPADAFVFTDDVTGAMPWKPTTTANRFTRCCAAAGLPATTRIHDLRALCGTHLADEGVPIPVIGQRLGHTLNSTTADLYVGRIPESDRLAADVMGRLLDAE